MKIILAFLALTLSMSVVTACDNFDMEAMTCLMPFAQLQGSENPDMKKICGLVREATPCMEKAIKDCSAPGEKSQVMGMWKQVSSMCPGNSATCDDFDMAAMNCLMPFSQLQGSEPDMNKICGLVKEATPCMDKAVKECPAPSESSQMMGMWKQVSSICPGK